jgi:hypothetical protein
MSVSVDVASMLRQLADQQSALGEQQAALLQLQTEIVHMQRALIEKAIGERAQDVVSTSVAMPSDNAPLDMPQVPPTPPAEVASKALVLPATSAPGSGQAPSAEDPPQQPEDSPIGEPPRLHLVTDIDSSDPVDPVHPAGVSPTLRGARYMQASPAKPARPVTWQDVDRVTRLYETGDAVHLVLQFGEHKGTTLFQVAQTDPDYVRRLALTAQRPQVRAAARQVVVALESVAAHKPLNAHAANRRSRTAG